MSEFAVDTHALYWHSIYDARLSIPARTILDGADAGFHRIFVPSIVLVEMVYLVERGRLDPDIVDRITTLVGNPAGSFWVAPLDQNTARALATVPRAAVPDMPDRIIAATAVQLGVPLITADERIQRSGVVPIVW